MAENTALDRADKAILEKAILDYVKKGYIIITRTDTTAQLLKKKKIDLLTGPVGYMFKRDKVIYLSVTAQGKVKAIKRNA